jgi:hypothetical protein
MNRNITRFVAGLVIGMFVSHASAQEKTPLHPEPAGMKQLFDGKTLEGWDGHPDLWTVKDGAIRGETTDEKKAPGNTFLVWKGGTVKDFELRLKFRLNAANNSGIQYRSKHFTNNEKNKWVVRGYQGEIRNEVKLPNVAGFIYDEGGKRGRIALVGERVTWEEGKKTVAPERLCTQADYEKAFKLDDWNEFTIVAKGNNIKHYINGLQVVDFTDKQADMALTEGVLALQIHAGKAMWVEFKDIRLKQD